MNAKGEGIALVPSQCPRFVAACFTAGIELQEGSPGISNTYSKAKKYDPDEPGDISYHLSRDKINPLALAKVWANPEAELVEVEALKGRLLACRDLGAWHEIADDIEALHLTAAIATISLFTRGKFAIDSKTVSDEEERAAAVLSGLSERMKEMKRPEGGQIAAIVAQCWTPAMFAWVKAWAFNYLEIRDAWKAASPSIKIERDGAFPLVLRKDSPDLARLLKRWVS